MTQFASKPGSSESSRPISSMSAALRLLMQVGDAGKTFSLPLRERMVLGRGVDGEQPEIDLSPHDALKNGVSRAHAVLSYREQEMYIEDLGSTNGTRINGFQIEPGRAYRLRAGDEIELGRLRLQLKVVRTPR